MSRSISPEGRGAVESQLIPGSGFSGQFAVDYDVGYTVAAKAVGAVEAAGYFTCRKEAGDGRSISFEDLGPGIDTQAAHSMMDGWFNADCIEWRCPKRRRHFRCATAEVLVRACLLLG